MASANPWGEPICDDKPRSQKRDLGHPLIVWCSRIFDRGFMGPRPTQGDENCLAQRLLSMKASPSRSHPLPRPGRPTRQTSAQPGRAGTQVRNIAERRRCGTPRADLSWKCFNVFTAHTTAKWLCGRDIADRLAPPATQVESHYSERGTIPLPALAPVDGDRGTS
jgi:hypothetical protein